MRDFLKANRVELDEAIRRVVPGCSLNDDERRQWVLNDEGLYRWARSAGVRV
jgi:gluconate kinase